jgi:hypothetical protein
MSTLATLPASSTAKRAPDHALSLTMPKRVAKANLPTKTCPVCQRPFVWRKKWERDWDSVIYCSERCRRTGR